MGSGPARYRFAMKILCPQCKTAYEIAPTALGSSGRQVRCVRCQSVWFAETPRLAADMTPAARQPVAAAPQHGVIRGIAAKSPATAAPDEPAPSPAAAEAATPEPADATAADPATAPPDDAEAALPPDAAGASAEPGDDPQSDPAAVESEAAEIANTPEEAAAPASAEAADAASPTPVNYESLAARRPKTRRVGKRRPPARSWRGQGWAALIIGLIVVNGSLIAGRSEVVRVLPQTASLFETIGLPVNLRNLAFEGIKTKHEQQDGVIMLVVEGIIATTGRTITEVPRLRFSIEAANGHEIYAWTALPTRTRLAPGETLPFKTRLASPPEQGRIIKVRFFTPLDLATGLR